MNNQPTTNQEVLSDPIFIGFVKEEISAIIRQRLMRPAPREGFHYKRDWYDKMHEFGCLNAEYFIKHIEAIFQKKSNLSSEFRRVIGYVCQEALIKAQQHYAKINEHYCTCEVSHIEECKNICGNCGKEVAHE